MPTGALPGAGVRFVIVGLNNASTDETFPRTLPPFDCDQSRHAEVPIAIAKTMRVTFDLLASNMFVDDVTTSSVECFRHSSRIHTSRGSQIQAASDLPPSHLLAAHTASARSHDTADSAL
jgi:hypothetical protein